MSVDGFHPNGVCGYMGQGEMGESPLAGAVAADALPDPAGEPLSSCSLDRREQNPHDEARLV